MRCWATPTTRPQAAPPLPEASTPSVLALCFDHGGRLGAGWRRARSDRRDGRQRCQAGAEPARAGREPARLRRVRRAGPRSAAPSIAGRPEVRPVPIRGGPARCASEPLQPSRQQRQSVEVARQRFMPGSGAATRPPTSRCSSHNPMGGPRASTPSGSRTSRQPRDRRHCETPRLQRLGVPVSVGSFGLRPQDDSGGTMTAEGRARW